MEKDYLNEQKNLKEDLRIERNIWELLRKKKGQEVNVNACLYGHHEQTTDQEIKFFATQYFQNNRDALISEEELKDPFVGRIEPEGASMCMRLNIPLRIEERFKTLEFIAQPQR